MSDKIPENNTVEFKEKLGAERADIKKPGDFWLGMGLFLILNFILWKFGSYIMNLDYISENYSYLIYKADNFQLPFGALILISLRLFGIFINGVVIALPLFKRRSLIFLGMVSVIPIAFMLYVIFSIIVFIYWVFIT